MRIDFSIHYPTQWGERVFVRANTDKIPLLALDYQENGHWQGTWATDRLPRNFAYRYEVRNQQGLVREEFALDRKVTAGKSQHLQLVDAWRDPSDPAVALHASAFEEVIFRPATVRKAKTVRQAVGKLRFTFQLHQVRVPAQLQLAILGNTKALGNWQPESALFLGSKTYPHWRADVLLAPGQSIEYKYALIDPGTKEVVHWETGTNRTYTVPYGADTVIKTDDGFRYADPYWKGTGLALPVFSIRTEESFGCGEFSDLKKLVDWSVELGMKMVQILPVNDTIANYTWVDSYPYAAVSVFALHPLYLSIDELEQSPAKADLAKQRKALNALDQVDYEKTVNYKLAYARKVYRKVKSKTLQSTEFETFFRENSHWLQDYAAFCYLRDQNRTPDFTAWETHRVYNEKEIAELTDPKGKAYPEVAFHYYLQFHLDRQLKAAGDYARSRGVVLKGDIPIGIYRHSADAWVAPELYNMDGQAGAPPDDFATEGQNWGFPTYDWAAMAKTDYQWWRQRFTQLSRYFDAFRIDHILGFFRIWETPIEQVEGILGRFNPALPVHIEEFQQRGIYFDYHRYCSPYITEELVREIFGEDADYVLEKFLETFYDRLQLREAYTTQRQIQAALSSEEQHLEKRLFSLVSNVLLLPVEGSNGSQFHPRIELQKTSSFQLLDSHTQGQITELYNDYFYHRQEEFWREKGMTKLPAMKDATNMLICGEDLGMVPDCVPEVMKQLGILSLEIQRMAKNSATRFLQPADIPYLSVCSPSTHDMSPLRLWWEEMKPGERQQFYNQELNWWGEAPATCSPELATAIIVQHLQWPTMWAVFPFQDLMAIDGELRHPDPAVERINRPEIIPHYWRYRMHRSVEDLLAADVFNTRVRELIEESGRYSPPRQDL